MWVRDLERQKCGKLSGAMAGVLVEGVDLKQGTATGIEEAGNGNHQVSGGEWRQGEGS